MKGTNPAWGKRGTRIQVFQPLVQSFPDRSSDLFPRRCGTFNGLENGGIHISVNKLSALVLQPLPQNF